MGKELNKRNLQHARGKPYNKDFKKHHNQRYPHHSPRGARDSFQQQRRHGVEPTANLTEEEVGIGEFVTTGQGFTGVVKARFSDFHVNEIDPSGKILQLNDLKIPQPLDDCLNEEELAEAKSELKDVITPEIWDRLAELKHQNSETTPTIQLDVSNLDKLQRTKLHKIIKKVYNDKLTSTTSNNTDEGEEEKKFVTIYPKKGRDRNRWNFPAEYVHFLVYKENMETSEVASIMAGRMGLRPSQVSYCGTKDKRAKTTQKFCIKRRSPSLIVNSIKGTNNVQVGNFEFHEEVLKLGQLKGNRFRVALRHVRGEKADIEAALQGIKDHGFINYYGLQRFGNCASVPTYEVGIALLKCDYKLACELIMKPRENDSPIMREVRNMWWKDRNASAAAELLYGRNTIEKQLLHGLSQCGGNDYASALRKIPRNMLLLYPHAFQSFIFNHIVSRRIKEFGLKLIPGDLVLRDKNDEDIEMASTERDSESLESSEEVTPSEATPPADSSNSTIEQKKENEEKELEADKVPIEEKESIYKRKVKPLTAEDVASGEWTIFDVVLPLPGFDVTFPGNEVAKWYEELLAEHGLSIAKLKHNVKTFSMCGAYRKMLVKPENMQWEFKTYDSPECTLIPSDWELLKNKEVESSAEEGQFKAVVIDVCLPASTYATMLLRELLKTGTSAATQSQLQREEMKKHNESQAVGKSEDEKITTEKRKERDDEDCNVENTKKIDDSNDSKKLKIDEEVSL